MYSSRSGEWSSNMPWISKWCRVWCVEWANETMSLNDLAYKLVLKELGISHGLYLYLDCERAVWEFWFISIGWGRRKNCIQVLAIIFRLKVKEMWPSSVLYLQVQYKSTDRKSWVTSVGWWWKICLWVLIYIYMLVLKDLGPSSPGNHHLGRLYQNWSDR